MPLSDALALTTTSIVYELESISVISYSWFNTAAVIFPPNETAPKKVTKFPLIAPFPASVTVTMLEPFTAANVASPAIDV